MENESSSIIGYWLDQKNVKLCKLTILAWRGKFAIQTMNVVADDPNSKHKTFIFLGVDEFDKICFDINGYGFDTKEKALAKYKEYEETVLMPLYEKSKIANERKRIKKMQSKP